MIDKDKVLSKEEGAYIKRKIDRLLKEFNTLTRGQIQNKLSLIVRHVGRKD